MTMFHQLFKEADSVLANSQMTFFHQIEEMRIFLKVYLILANVPNHLNQGPIIIGQILKPCEQFETI